jgi:hypothetical protein
MLIKEDELELDLLHEEHLRVERGSGWLGEEEGVVLYREVISPDWYYQPGLKAGSLVLVGVTSRD